jgi:UDP-2,4-diacetamido-2,4,6-trideoxy-beta-L-altropyranose hydrolase
LDQVENTHPPLARIYFRCDAGRRIGLGHLVRCLALANMLHPVFEAHFLIQDPEPALANQITAEGFAFTALPQTDDYGPEALQLVAALFRPGDLVVLDGYHFTTSYQEILKQQDLLLVCIDDLQAFPFAADVIINQAGGVDPNRYNSLPHTRLCLGPDYALLREPFLQAARQVRPVKAVQRIFLNMGGADPHNDTCRLLQQITSLAPEWEVEVVTGSAFAFGEPLAALGASNPRIRIHRQLTAAAMCRLMQSCQAAILPPSSVSYEWCSVGGPLFLCQTADNQSAMRSFLIRENLADDYSNFAAFRQLPEAEAHAARQLKQQRKYFGGQSPKNLRGVFQQLYFGHWLELRRAGPADMLLLYQWANDPAVRLNSFNQSPIPLEVHRIWFENKIAEITSLFLVARIQGTPAGMIRYDLKESQGVISYLIDRNFRGKSLGALLLQKGEQVLRSQYPEITTLIGHVQETNLASVISFQKNLYTPSQTIPPMKPGAVVFEKRI